MGYAASGGDVTCEDQVFHTSSHTLEGASLGLARAASLTQYTHVVSEHGTLIQTSHSRQAYASYASSLIVGRSHVRHLGFRVFMP